MSRTIMAIAATLALTGTAYAGPCTDRITQIEKSMNTSDAGSGPTNMASPSAGGSGAPSGQAAQTPGTSATPAMNATVGNKAASPADVRAQTQGNPTAAQGGSDQSKQLSDALATAKAADAKGDAAACGKALDEAQKFIKS